MKMAKQAGYGNYQVVEYIHGEDFNGSFESFEEALAIAKIWYDAQAKFGNYRVEVIDNDARRVVWEAVA
jgi:hypothetical protein